MAEVFEKVYRIVQQIPKGKVLTYGLISNLLEGRLSAQGVGWALNGLSSSKKAEAKKARKSKNKSKSQDKDGEGPLYHSENVPWHRVINSRGFTSTHKRPEMPPDLQKRFLEEEGVIFDEQGKVDLNKYLWDCDPDSEI